MTRMWDVRLGKTHLTVSKLQSLLLITFQHLLDEELVLGIDAATCFMLALEVWEARALIPHEHGLQFKEQYDGVKVTCAPRFKAMQERVRSLALTPQQHQQQLEALEHNIVQLQQYLVNKHISDMHRHQRDRIISLISTALFLVGGPALRLVGDWSQPLDLLTAIMHVDGDGLTRLITDTIADFMCRKSRREPG